MAVRCNSTTQEQPRQHTRRGLNTCTCSVVASCNDDDHNDVGYQNGVQGVLLRAGFTLSAVHLVSKHSLTCSERSQAPQHVLQAQAQLIYVYNGVTPLQKASGQQCSKPVPRGPALNRTRKLSTCRCWCWCWWPGSKGRMSERAARVKGGQRTG